MDLITRWHDCDIYLHHGDITRLAVDAIVNAANPWLRGGGGVDGAIHRAGGPQILAECQKIIAERGKPLDTGAAVLTTGGNLPARFVIHTVGPVHYSMEPDEAARLLAACYQYSLALARQHNLRGIAFPCISTGVYGYPSEDACPIALAAVQAELAEHGHFQRVVFCTFDNNDERIYRRHLASPTRH